MLDKETREIARVYIGKRDCQTAKQRWFSLPAIHRYCEWGKKSGEPIYIHRFNYTLRQRVSPLVRKALSFSKKLDDHIGDIWMFIHHNNDSLQASLSV